MPNDIQVWLNFLDADPAIASQIHKIENSTTLKIVKREYLRTSELQLPKDRLERVAVCLTLLREISDPKFDFLEFARKICFSSGDIAECVMDVSEKLFVPAALSVRHLLIGEYDRWQSESLHDVIPAADRIVSLNHNSDDYMRVIDAAEALKDALRQTNELDQPDKERVSAELSAARELLKSKKVRAGAIVAVLVPSLKWLAEAFAGTAVGMAAESLFQSLLSLFPGLF